MAIDTVSSVTASEQLTQKSLVGIDDFFKIFLTQLNYQDPLEPLKNEEFIAQLAQFSNLELSRQTGEDVTNLVNLTSTTQTLGLLGRDVEVTNTAGGVTLGRVVGVELQGSVPTLTVRSDSGEILQGISPANVSFVR